ncbi:YqhR family membrane protein [Bacillus marinisedimentorum]|uniref:YqhR family membrane protein n=1 Tax=Bacillus marinisedimentorum TaxID=1821260 RepID=UPI000872E6F7|nr:YqhR family membrane protein [Bacillus marinisedimentorum]
MTEDNGERLEQNEREPEMSLSGRTAVTGLFGGIFWSLLGYIAYLLNFTSLSPSLVLGPWAVGDWKTGQLGHIIGIIVIGLLSILAAFIYYALLKNIKNMWGGLLFGAGLFLLVFFVLNPLFPNLENIGELDQNTLFTTVALYLLYGVFIGYSISYENNELMNARRQPGYSNE